MLRLYGGVPVASPIAIAYIDVFRSVPVLVLLIVIYYALPFVGIRLSLLLGGHECVKHRVCGLFRRNTSRWHRRGAQGPVPRPPAQLGSMPLAANRPDVILLQAVRLVIPPLTSNSINVMKDTSLASVVAMPDLSLKQATQAQALAANPTPLIGCRSDLASSCLLPFVRSVGILENRLITGRGR